MYLLTSNPSSVLSAALQLVYEVQVGVIILYTSIDTHIDRSLLNLATTEYVARESSCD